MNSAMRQRLENNVAYHAALADHHQARHEELAGKPEEKPAEENQAKRRWRSGDQPAEGDAAETAENKSEAKAERQAEPAINDPQRNYELAEMHGGAARQLRDVISGVPVVAPLDQARQNQPVRRRAERELHLR